MIIIIVGTPDHVVLFGKFCFEFVDQVVEMVELLSQVGIVPPQPRDLLVSLAVQFLKLPIFLLKCPQNLVIFSDDSLFALIHHLELLVVALRDLLNFLDLLVS